MQYHVLVHVTLGMGEERTRMAAPLLLRSWGRILLALPRDPSGMRSLIDALRRSDPSRSSFH